MTLVRLRRALRPVARVGRLGQGTWDVVAARRWVRRLAGDETLEIRAARRTRGGMRIFRVEGSAVGSAVLKATRSPVAAEALERERAALVGIRSAARADAIQRVLPDVLATGEAGGWWYLLQRALPGEPATRIAGDSLLGDRFLHEASTFAGELHRLTARQRPVTEDELEAWIRRPVSVIGSLLGTAEHERMARLSLETAGSLPDRLALGWMHGDFWSENVLVDTASGHITGVVDWDSAEGFGLGHHDRLHLVLYRRKRQRGSEIGEEICRVLSGSPAWDAAEGAAIDAAIRALDPAAAPGALRLAVVLYWMRLVVHNLARQPSLRRRRAWVAANVGQVLACL